MRLGLFMMPVHPPTRPMHEVLAEDIEKCLLADRLGFDEMFLGEHYSASTEPYPSPLMFMASLIARTRNLDFGTGVISLPNRHPALIAGEAAQFDHMSRGRFILGIGTGSLVSDFELLGNGDPALRNRMLVESIDMIEKIWSQDPPYDIKGEFWTTQIARTRQHQARHRHHPQALSAARARRSASPRRAPIRRPCRLAGPARMGTDLELVPHRDGRRDAIGRCCARARPRPAARPTARTGASCAASMSRRATPRRASG